MRAKGGTAKSILTGSSAGTGSGELLAMRGAGAGRCLGTKGGFALFLSRSYPLLAHKVGATPVFAEDDGYAASRRQSAGGGDKEKPKWFFFDNPNNPVGTFLPRRRSNGCTPDLPADVLLVVDEAYGEYVDPALQNGDPSGPPPVGPGFRISRGAPRKRAGQAAPTFFYQGLWSRFGAGRLGHRSAASDRPCQPLAGARSMSRSADRRGGARGAGGDQDFVTGEPRAQRRRAYAGWPMRLRCSAITGLPTSPSEANFLLVHFEGAVSAAQARDALAEAGYRRAAPAGTGPAEQPSHHHRQVRGYDPRDRLPADSLRGSGMTIPGASRSSDLACWAARSGWRCRPAGWASPPPANDRGCRGARTRDLPAGLVETRL